MSLVAKRSVSIRGHRTSISLEQAFFDELTLLAAGRNMPLAALIAEIDGTRPQDANLSSALRLYVLEQLKARLKDGAWAARAVRG
ncbi:MAG: ribbon-helix-helix domain-containing protein [Rhizobiaceae bacterium]|nr:ribbon-helix-helix domain-containing protein [Rhizobiaceae bacterium]